MKTSYAFFAMLLASTAAQAQQPVSDNPPTNPRRAAPLEGFDHAALEGSARASKLIGSKVYQGDSAIGEIEDVLVDLNQSKLIAVILSVGGFLGVGNKLIAVPVDKITVGTEAKFTTDLTKEQLAAAPAFDFSTIK